MTSFTRPRGKITTLTDIVSRDSQDNYLFPLDSTQTWFSDVNLHKSYTTSNSIQEWPYIGNANWGGRFEFVLNKIQIGDLLRDVIFQFRLGHWYDNITISNMQNGYYSSIVQTQQALPWTYCNSLGTDIIDYAELQIGDQTIERLTGEFIRVFYTLYPDINTAFGLASDAIGEGNVSELQANTGMYSPLRPWPTDRGIYFCVLPFFFSRVRLKETIPVLSCADKSIRIIIKLKQFTDVVRIADPSGSWVRESCMDTPLGKTVTFNTSSIIIPTVTIQTSQIIPPIQDVKIVTICPLVSDALRLSYLQKPVEQLYKLVQNFSFDEPLKYLVSKPNASIDTISIQLPLELNHPVQELIWVFRRKAVQINNEWNNFRPFVDAQFSPTRNFPEWLAYATLRINGSVVEEGPGSRYRYTTAQKHLGGLIAWSSYIYGYSFAEHPNLHRPSGTVNMSRSYSVSLNLTVNAPFNVPASSEDLSGFGPEVSSGWEVHVFALYYNWIRYENGIANRIFSE